MRRLVFILLLSILRLLPSSSSGGNKPVVYDGTAWYEIAPIDQVSTSQQQRPLPPISNSWKDPNVEIYVSIVSFRDSERCANTLKDLFAKAKYPDRIRVGLVQQTAQDEKDCMDLFCGNKMWQSMSTCTRAKQVYSILMAKFESKGPSFARYLTQEDMGNAEFCMQTDSHVNFVRGWDVVALDTWAATKNEYAVLSTSLPDSMKSPSEAITSSKVVPHLCSSSWTDRGMVRNDKAKAAANLQEPILSNLWSAGFSFSKCHAERKVPPDPHLHQCWDGEEFAKYARLWTRGYDVYTPHKIIATHDYSPSKIDPYVGPNRPGGPSQFDWTANGMSIDYKRQMFDESVHRISTLLGTPDGRQDIEAIASLTHYGLGTKRNLDQLIAFTGINLREKTMLPEAKQKCQGRLEWVPFDVDTDPTTDSSDVWGFAPMRYAAGDLNIPLKTGTKELSSTSVSSSSSQKKKKKVTTKREITVHEESKHSGELWYIFQLVDAMIDILETSLKDRLGPGKGHQALQIVLLMLPVLFVVLGGATYLFLTVDENKKPESAKIAEFFGESDTNKKV